MNVITNKGDYKKVFSIIAIIIILLFEYSNLVYAESDYSISKLNRDMNAIMNSIPKNNAQPYTPYGQESMNEIQRRFNEAKKSGEIFENLKIECANGNDNACISAGIDINDPCRPYLANNAERNACRVQQCNDGNQTECNKINVYNERKQNAENNLQRARENNSTRTCESYCMRSKINCYSSCRSFSPTDSNCSENCERDFILCKSNC